jgi:ribosomal protein S18 acetylase RimI-like enzyme
VSGEVVRELRDRQGRRYELVDLAGKSEAPVLVVRHQRGTRVGLAKTRLRGAELELLDLQVEKSAILKGDGVLGGILSGGSKVDLRGNGFGSAMLEHLINRARGLGVEKVMAFVTAEHRESNSHLLAWFAKRGFHPAGTIIPSAVTLVRSMTAAEQPDGVVLGRAGSRKSTLV